ncbi:MAG: hypothetical protein ACRCZF_27650, partial [Gemmataceae bacterium]
MRTALRVLPSLFTPTVWRTPRLLALCEWFDFLFAAGLLVAMLYGPVRQSGVAALIITTLLGGIVGRLDRRTLVQRLSVLGLTLLVAYLLKHNAPSILAHRAGRFTLAVGFGLTLLLSLPVPLRQWLRKWAFQVQLKPLGRAGFVTALLGVFGPVFVLQMNTTEYVWTGDTTPVVPTVVQMWRHGTRDLSSYLPPTGRARWDVCA